MMMCSLSREPNRAKNREESELVESNGGILVDRLSFILAERDDQIVYGVKPRRVSRVHFANRPIRSIHYPLRAECVADGVKIRAENLAVACSACVVW